MELPFKIDRGASGRGRPALAGGSGGVVFDVRIGVTLAPAAFGRKIQCPSERCALGRPLYGDVGVDGSGADVGGVLDAPPVFLESYFDALPAQRVRVFQLDAALVALELDASGYLKIHGIGHQRPASNRVGRENGAARDLKCSARFRNGGIKNWYQGLACIDLQCIVAPRR